MGHGRLQIALIAGDGHAAKRRKKKKSIKFEKMVRFFFGTLQITARGMQQAKKLKLERIIIRLRLMEGTTARARTD